MGKAFSHLFPLELGGLSHRLFALQLLQLQLFMTLCICLCPFPCGCCDAEEEMDNVLKEVCKLKSVCTY